MKSQTARERGGGAENLIDRGLCYGMELSHRLTTKLCYGRSVPTAQAVAECVIDALRERGVWRVEHPDGEVTTKAYAMAQKGAQEARAWL